ncbi:MAG: efflux RND transporter permease subunit [Myxococcales bacterium]|nr:efflux RND transporter permease subunit [Myxococcales bacterium]
MVDAFASELPGGVKVEHFFDQTGYTSSRLFDLQMNMLQGLIIVVVVLFLTLGARAAAVVSLTLPVVVLGSVGVLRLLGVPIHQMSVTGLIVALGLLVDNAIVMTDAVQQRLVRGEKRRDAVKDASRVLWVPLASSTVTTVLAFMPIVLLKGRVGEFVGTLGMSVIVALVTSYAVAMTLVPAISGFVLSSKERAGFWSHGLELPVVGSLFDRSIAWSLSRPVTSALLVSIIPVIGFGAITQMPRQFFPPADRNQFVLELRGRPSASMNETEKVVERVDAFLRDQDEVEHIAWVLGRSAPPFYYNLKQDQEGQSQFAQALVQTRRATDVLPLLRRIQPELDRREPSVQAIGKELLQGPPVDAPIELRIFGPDVNELRRIGDEYRSRLARVSTVIHSTSSLTSGSPEVVIDVDEAKLRKVGLSHVMVATQLSPLPGRHPGGLHPRGGRRHSSPRPRFGRGASADLGPAVMVFQPPAVTSVGVPLEAVGTVEVEPTLDRISRRNGRRVNIVRGFTVAGVFPDTALGQLDHVLADDPVPLPPGYAVELGGDAEGRSDASANLAASMPVLVLLMVATVALSLGSFRLGGLVFVVAVQSIGLGLACLGFSGHPLGFNATIGLIGLVGVAINAAIIINSALLENEAARVGSLDAVRHVVVNETSRHIVSTTITTFGGFLPLMLSPGGFWPPFAISLAGGVFLSTIVTFYFVPPCFVLLCRWRRARSTSGATSLAEVHS